MIITKDHTSIKLEATQQEALELIRQLANAVAVSSRSRSGCGYCFVEGVSYIDETTKQTPGVLTVVID